MKHLFIYILLVGSISCTSKFGVTREYAYSSDNFNLGFSISLLTHVEQCDERGLPKNPTDSIRFDLTRYGGANRNKIYFFKKNEGYYWKKFLSTDKFEILPFKFEKRNWYVIWGGDLKSGLFKENHHSFFIYCDSTGTLNVHEEVFQTNL